MIYDSMNDEERKELSRRSETLRNELKTWEKDFRNKHGRKASRDDIKKDVDIKQVHKEYNWVSDVLSGKIVEKMPPKDNHTPRKRKRDEGSLLGVSKRIQTMKTPSKTSQNPWEVDPYESPNMIRKLFTPSKKTTIGPTPQKDGQVLGLFDLMGVTPEKPEDVAGTQSSIKATPGKSVPLNSALKLGNTPSTASKRKMLEGFSTPRKGLKFDRSGSFSGSRKHFTTPSFLRRDSQRVQMPPVNEDSETLQLSPQMTRGPRKPLMRGLSSIVASLRQQQEDALDEELEALRDMENNMSNSASSKPAPSKASSNNKPKVTLTAPDDILVEDSQPGFPLGGFDDESANDSEPEEMKNLTLGRDGLPLKVYKKKGQKRTTRAVKMKPSRTRPALALPRLAQESDDELSAVPETQLGDAGDADEENAGADFDDARNFDSDSQSEYTASEGGTRYRRPDQSKKRKVMTKKGKIRAVGRKVTSLASQNFKRLKLRNSGAQGGAAHNSRFRRKR